MPATPIEVLTDFDWKLLYSVASDRIASLKCPTLRLQLSTAVDKNGSVPREVVLEYSKEDLDRLIAEMERMQKSLGG